MRNLIEILDLSVEEIDELIKVAKSIMQSPEDYSEICKHKKLATLFFEPSTRTRLSFESAMIELGGNVIGFSSASSSSAISLNNLICSNLSLKVSVVLGATNVFPLCSTGGGFLSPSFDVEFCEELFPH